MELDAWDFRSSNFVLIFCLESLHVISLVFQILWCWWCSVCQCSFNKLVIWKKICYMEWQGLDMCFFDDQFLEAVFIVWEFWWNLYEFFLLFVYLGTCIGKFCNHSINVIIRGFHISVVFVSHESHIFYGIVNVVKVRFW